jgi:hypothetical protein
VAAAARGQDFEHLQVPRHCPRQADRDPGHGERVGVGPAQHRARRLGERGHAEALDHRAGHVRGQSWLQFSSQGPQQQLQECLAHRPVDQPWFDEQHGHRLVRGGPDLAEGYGQ